MTALWKQNSLIMWKYLKEELFTAVKILKGNPAPLLIIRRVLQRVLGKAKSNLGLVEKIILSKRGGCVFVSFDIKDRSSILLSLGFPFWSSHLTKQYLFWMHSIYFLKKSHVKTCINRVDSPYPQYILLFLFKSLDGLIIILFPKTINCTF